ncbi:hypothetical protein AO391_20425 [Pseudomonas marginalis ICMP 9505]|nr:hypothetical protein AO391_20425 [Pseudomonas marginalis ICMP 9505]
MRSTVGAGLARDGINSVYLMVRGACIASKPAPTKALLIALILGAAPLTTKAAQRLASTADQR